MENDALKKKLMDIKMLVDGCLAELGVSVEEPLKHGGRENANISRKVSLTTGKQKTLREIIKGKSFKNGSEKIAMIVGYHERYLGKLIKEDTIKKEWIVAKIEGTYKTNLLEDAADVYIRVLQNGDCDLTQTGEEFFEKFIKNEPLNQTSK